MRRLAIGGATAVILLVLVAGCGGSSASPSASADPSAATTPAATDAQATDPAASDGGTSSPAASQDMTAACAAVGVRKTPAVDGAVLVRLGRGAVVRAVETVSGDPYKAAACGTSGEDWLKIDRINGKSVKSLFGVTYAYAAAGFFR